MWRKLVLLGVLSTMLVMVTHAAPSAEEIALRNAILSSGPSTYTLTKNIILTQDLPPLADEKILIVKSASISGAPFKIDGQNKYKIFQYTQGLVVKLTLNNIILTRSPAAVYLFGFEPAGNPPFNFIELRASKVKFISNSIALQLTIVSAFIDTCEFTGQRQTAIQIGTEEGLGDIVRIKSTTFSKNAGAIFAGRYSSITVDKSKFDQNKADTGAAILVDRSGSAVVTNSQFTNNVATNIGGAIFLRNAQLTGSGLVFKSNVATQGGGAVYLQGNSDLQQASFASFKSSSFTDNKSLKTPGGAFLLVDSGILFCRTTFLRNLGKTVASDGYVFGGSSLSGTANPIVTIASGGQLVPGTDNCT